MPCRVIVVDDEALGRRGITSRLAAWSQVEVVATAATGKEAVAAIRAHRPDLLFLDVQMPGLDGFGVLAALRPQERPRVIFVTAHDRHALRAFEVHALDYLLKPIDDERFSATVSRALEALAGERDQDVGRRVAQLVAHRGLSPAPDASAGSAGRLAVRDGGRIVLVQEREIDWIEAAGDYVRIHAGARRLLHRCTLTAIAKQLQEPRFVRVHRSAIVNVDRVRELRPLEGGDWDLLLSTGTKLRLSRSYRDAVDRLTAPG